MPTNWQTILSGIATAAAGLAIIYFSVAMIPPEVIDSSIRSVLVLAGVGMVTGGAGIAAARADATSKAAHRESLEKIEEGEARHLDNQSKIASLTMAVNNVPDVVSRIVADERPVALIDPSHDQRRPGAL